MEMRVQDRTKAWSGEEKVIIENLHIFSKKCSICSLVESYEIEKNVFKRIKLIL